MSSSSGRILGGSSQMEEPRVRPTLNKESMKNYNDQPLFDPVVLLRAMKEIEEVGKQK